MNDLFQMSLDYQKKFAEKWMENLKKLNPAQQPKDLEGLTEWYSQMVKSYQDMMQEWAKNFTGENPFLQVQPWVFNPFNSLDTQADVFNKIMNSSKVYTDLYALYQNLVGKDPFQSAEEIQAFLKGQQAVYEGLADDILTPMIPAEAKELLNASKDVYHKWAAENEKLVAPWVDQAKASKAIYERIAKGDFAAYKDLYEGAVKAYEASYGKIFKVIGVGINRENNEQLLEGFDSFNRLYIAQTQLLAFVEDVAKNNMVEVIKRFQELVKPENQPKTMKDFVDLYVKVNDEVFTKLMAGDEFSKLFSEYGKYYAIFKQECDVYLEKVLGFLPFPKNSDMKELYKTVYDLRKQCYYDHKAIKALEKEVEELQATQKKATK